MKNWKRRWALFLAAALLALSLTGCGGSGEGPALSVCVGGAPEELDPIYATETADQTVLVHLYENLMRKTGDGSGGTTVTNGAAKSVSTEENADGTVTWTAFTGVGVSAEATEAQGSIEVEFTPEIVEAMQTGNVLVAVVSAA